MNNIVAKEYSEADVCGHNLPVAVGSDGKHYVSPRRVCEALGIDWSSQRTKIMADEVLGSTVVEITTVAQDGKKRSTTMMPIEFFSGWLFTIKKAKPSVQPMLNRFRLEGFIALDAWFRKGMREDDSPHVLRVHLERFWRQESDSCQKHYWSLPMKIIHAHGRCLVWVDGFIPTCLKRMKRSPCLWDGLPCTCYR